MFTPENSRNSRSTAEICAKKSSKKVPVPYRFLLFVLFLASSGGQSSAHIPLTCVGTFCRFFFSFCEKSVFLMPAVPAEGVFLSNFWFAAGDCCPNAAGWTLALWREACFELKKSFSKSFLPLITEQQFLQNVTVFPVWCIVFFVYFFLQIEQNVRFQTYFQ